VTGQTPDIPELDPYARLRAMTQARVALGRSGAGLPTRAMLAFQRDHALARDAVRAVFRPGEIIRQLPGLATVIVASRATDREAYLRRPDLGRRLDRGDAQRLVASDWDLAIVVADGLSATAAHAHAAPLITRLVARLGEWRIAPVVLASMARVALGDEIGASLGARMVLMLLGERPGLSAPDSLGGYLTWDPVIGRLDSQRNCVSNIRPPLGLGYEAAADSLAWLATTARDRSTSGVALRDERAAAPALPRHPAIEGRRPV
jgi:ethanolamine ammonia-lyase small subunit